VSDRWDGSVDPGHHGGGRLRTRLESGAFAVTAEISPPRGADTAPVRQKAEMLRGWVDAVNITDNQSSFVRLSAFAGSLTALAAGVDPVMQVTCRDRNRIALQSDLLSAGAMGIPNVLLMGGDHPRQGDHADAKPVFDLDTIGLIEAARTMRDEGRLMSGRVLDPPPTWFMGAVENPFAPDGSGATRLAKKVEAGAQFIQTQFVFDVRRFAGWMGQIGDLGLLDRCHILAGVGPIRSARALEHMRTKVPGVVIPDEVAARLLGVPENDLAEESMRLCVELIDGVRQVPGVSGVHLMAVGFEQGIPDILREAGIDRRGPSSPVDPPS
jgi:methylenetetrahydrofolate reductase (NADPH)